MAGEIEVNVNQNNNQVNLTQSTTNVVEVKSIGPQGAKGDKGDTGPQPDPGSITGSLHLTGSLTVSSSFVDFTNATTISGVVATNGGDSLVQTVQGTLKLSGDIIAENYIISSSVTYMTQSFHSGSTIFGDSLDDTHQFTGSVSITGSTTISNSLTANGITYPTTDGDNGDIIYTNGSGVLTFDKTKVYANVKNISGTTLQKGTPVHVVSSVGNADEVIAASASNPSTMPATFILSETLVDEQEGLAILTGFINGVDTRGFTEGEVVYVGANGGYTNQKPSGSNLIQNLGIVTKVAENGSGFIYGSGRANDTPNLLQSHIFFGSSSNQQYQTHLSSAIDLTTLNNITASGNISSSGTVYGVTGSFSHLVGNSPITIGSPVTFTQAITGSVFSGSFVGDASGLSGVVADGTLSSSAQIATEISGAFTQVSGAFNDRINNNTNNITNIENNYLRTTTFTEASGGFSTRISTLESSGGGGSGIFNPTGSVYATTNDLQITGSLIVDNGGSNTFIVDGSGSTIFEIRGSEGTLFQITDSLSGSLFSVSDISGFPQFEVFSDGQVLFGWSPQSLYTTAKIESTTAATTQSIYSISTSSYDGAFFEYTVTSASNMRAGTISAIWEAGGTNINYSDVSTLDIGSTSGVDLLVNISQSKAHLQSITDTSSWKIKTIIRSI